MSSGSFRHELKFLISEWERSAITRRLEAFLKRDDHAKNGQYMIRSLYFDDRFLSSYEDKMAGVDVREKYRIRIYNLSDEVIRLERKRKEGQYIQKSSVGLSRKEAEALTNGDYCFLSQRPESLCGEFYRAHVEKGMRPEVIVDYEREPWVYPYGDVRITFDGHVRAGLLGRDLFDPEIPVAEVSEPGCLIMEVKYTEFLPELVRDLLSVADSEYLAYSKYTMCLEKREEWRNL